MAADRILNLYLPRHLREGYEDGQVNILSQILAALPGWKIAHHPDDEGLVQPLRPGFSLTHMQEPLHPGTLCLRRTYWYPFWRIAPTNERWNYDVAHKQPDYRTIPPLKAATFHNRLRDRVLERRSITRQGFVFMPLQGRLLQHRSFQSMSPAEMIAATLEVQPLPVVATLHPGETYSRAERRLLETVTGHPRFSIVETPAADLIAACDFVVCQNSSLALQAMIAGKGAVLFAGIDFHHPAGSVPREGLAQAFAKGREAPEAVADYLWWFFRREAIDAQSPEAPVRIHKVLAAEGWPVGP